MTCLVCSKRMPANDAVPFATRAAHVVCLLRVQLDKAPRGKVLVMVGRKGFRTTNERNAR
jgi:hypothetical protein